MKFSDALIDKKNRGFVPVIADIKCKSPKEGDLMRGRNPVEVARTLKECGAPALSVVTENKSFGGSLELLEQIVKATHLPVLCKDFINTKKQLRLIKEAGAAAVLLMLRCLDFDTLKEFYHHAYALGLEVLVETHTEHEIMLASELGAKMIGINNRDITVFEMDNGTVSATELLAKNVQKDSILISESAISTPSDVKRAIISGATAVLIGTAILKSEDIANTYKTFTEVML